jgi:phosphoribosylformimino-5-aminoimidazole carboxamide ribotide isomerase
MLIIPAIDLLDGKCVRLYKGDYSRSTEYSLDPVQVAKGFEYMGARRIHLVDLGAAKGSANSRKTIIDIRKNTNAVIETGGGIRTEEDVRELLDAGIDRLVVGTMMIKNPDEVRIWIKKFGKKFIAGIDAYDGEVKIAGWENHAGLSDTEAAVKAEKMGFISIIYTNISRDGTLTGPDLERTNIMAGASSLPVILSGGISNYADVSRVCRDGDGKVNGIIIGKAYYEGKLNLKEAFDNLQKTAGNDLW